MAQGLTALAQNGFQLPEKQRRDKIQFELVNNLPIIDVELNGTKLSFILDSGVKSTILFSLEATDSLELKNTEPIQLQGLGEGGFVDAFKSQGNKIKVGDAIDIDHTLFIIFDKSLNFSPRMGIPIHGILGSDFFQNFVVKINYAAENVVIFNPKRYALRKCRKCVDVPIIFSGKKPYISLMLNTGKQEEEITLLVDSGSSDALWLFEDYGFLNENPKNYFTDFLGLGLSGNIYGKRTKLPEIQLGEISLLDVKAAFPDKNAIANAQSFKERDGSLGGSFLRRFTVVMDYGNKIMRFKKNRKFNEPFNYNMSGLTIEHDGLELIKKPKKYTAKGDRLIQDTDNSPFNIASVSTSSQFEFSLVPKFIVVEMRENSPAAQAGILLEDEIVRVNGKSVYEYKLYELIELFSSEEGKKIVLDVNRGGSINKVKFNLKNVF
ncbi:aspartyl protease family protein [Aequorivita echinoideorum]|nr:aspartyl protease family protein [Aequorivita echinoideorum]